MRIGILKFGENSMRYKVPFRVVSDYEKLEKLSIFKFHVPWFRTKINGSKIRDSELK